MKTPLLFKNISILALVFFVFSSFLFQNKLYAQEEKKKIFILAEEMPRFPGCEDEPTKEKKAECANQKMMEYIYSNLKYPPIALENGIAGRVVARFVVNDDSSISDIEILREIGGKCGEEVKRVIESMNNMPEKWIPGKQGNRKVNVYITIPVIFQLNDKSNLNNKTKEKIISYVIDKDTVFLKNEELPIFPKFLSMHEDINSHNELSLNEFILSNLVYTNFILANNKSDEVLVEFKVNKKGEIRNVKVLKDFGYGSSLEAIRVIYSLNYLKNKWTPATYKGRKTDSYLRYAVKFQIKSNMLNNSSSQHKSNISAHDYVDEVFTSCENLPVIRGCEEFSSEKERFECSEKKLKEFLYSNLHYPPYATEQGIKGTVIVEFVVDEVGKINNIKIIKDIGGGCGEEVIKVVEGMNKIDKMWKSGSHEGKNVKVLIKYPVVFMLNG